MLIIESEEGMPRPCKRRCVSGLPLSKKFGPLDRESKEVISMTVEEYEVIKLIDLEKLTQAEAAERLSVSRTTVQAIYQKAREKIAKALVEVKSIDIDGGNYIVMKNKQKNCRKKRCCHENSSSK